jgi:integrase
VSVFKRYKGQRITPKHPQYAKAKWWVYKRLNGRVIHRSIPEAQNKAEAELAEREIVRQAFNRRYGVADSKTSFTSFANGKYWQYVEQNNVNITAKRQYVRILCEHFSGLLTDISPQGCRDCQWALQRGDLSPSSVNRIMSTLSKIFTLACEEGILDRNPMQYVRMLKEPPPRKRLLTNKEKERLWKCLSDDLFLSRVVSLALNLPLRKGQLAAITPDAVNFQNGTLYTVSSKGRAARIIPLNSTALTTLRCMVTDSQLPFPLKDFRRRWKRVMVAAGVNKPDGKRGENFTFHDLRKEFATELLRRNVNPNIIQKLFAHSDMSITNIYTDADSAMLFDAVNTLDATTLQPSNENEGFVN